MLDRIRCEDCRGTGHEDHDCWLCRGYGSAHWRRLIQYGGVRKADLIDLEGDGYAECPRCEGRLCWVCKGDGYQDAYVADQARDRVLICALTGTIPPIVRREPWRRRIRLDDDALLSRAAAAACRDEGLISWACSVFGDEIYITDAGRELARIAQVRHTLRAGVQI